MSLANPQSLEPTAREISAGDVLEGKWRVEKKLGEGGMGTVVLATDLQLQRLVAVKVLARHLCHDATSVARFEREARLTAQLDHPNIIPVYAVGRFHERPFIVMKYLEGEPLAEVLRRQSGPWPWEAARPIIEPLCRGLAYLHGRGLVHRDVKPSNVFLGRGGHVTLLDFGILKETSGDATTTGQVMGTLRFMAPEQLQHDTPVDARADIYALGVVLYRMLAGQTPFPGDDLAVAQRKLAEDPPSAEQLNPDLPPAVGEVLHRAVQRVATERQKSVSELFDELDAASTGRHERVAPRRSPWLTRAAVAASLMAIAGVAAVGVARQRTTPGRSTEVRAPTPTAPTATAAPPEPAAETAKASPRPVPPAAEVDAPTATSVVPPPAPSRRPVKVARSTEPVKVSVVGTVEGKSSYAELFVDGKSHGEVPTQIELTPGKHRFRLTRDGFRPAESTVDVGAGHERVVIDLKR